MLKGEARRIGHARISSSTKMVGMVTVNLASACRRSWMQRAQAEEEDEILNITEGERGGVEASEGRRRVQSCKM